jgi:hypothetical protein
MTAVVLIANLSASRMAERFGMRPPGEGTCSRERKSRQTRVEAVEMDSTMDSMEVRCMKRKESC